ncbi:MAG: diacylglycerol kinase family lipid kinase [Deltaproteobacteria bacterium]|nr:diacylglycerol kinase family lipid kinase [Deltaproteobacteria bacterium]
MPRPGVGRFLFMRVTVIINPISGRQGGAETARRRAILAQQVLTSAGITHEVRITEYPGHAYLLAREAVAREDSLVFAWGGDGTMNEVGRALAFSNTTLGLIPAGSGNGLARELHVSMEPEDALTTALRTPDRAIDVGEINGHLFFNAAGVGFDAHVTWLFNTTPHGRRGMLSYVIIAARELFRYRAPEYTVTVGGETISSRALLIAVTNSRQYGNGALIAPNARLDDGQLDMVVIQERSPLATLWAARRLFNGTLARAKGITTKRVTQATIRAHEPLRFHVDGEPVTETSTTLSLCLHPGALRIRGGNLGV